MPLILPDDIKRIQDSLSRPLSTFLTFYRFSDFEDPIDPSDERFFITRHGKLSIGLARVDLPDGGVGCIFLLQNNMCSIHAFKPFICRQYPFEPIDSDNYINGGFKVIDNPCFGNHAEDEVIDLTPAQRNYIVYKQKQDEYIEKITEWNANPQSKEKEIEDFLLFVGLKWS